MTLTKNLLPVFLGTVGIRNAQRQASPEIRFSSLF